MGVVLHEIDTGADILLLTSGDKFQRKGVPAGGDTISARVISTIEGAVLGASRAIWAKSGVPGITSVTVGETGGSMEPTPVGIENNLSTRDSRAATRGGTLLPRKGGMSFGGVSTDLLTKRDGSKWQGKKGKLGEHFGESCNNKNASRANTNLSFIPWRWGAVRGEMPD